MCCSIWVTVAATPLGALKGQGQVCVVCQSSQCLVTRGSQETSSRQTGRQTETDRQMDKKPRQGHTVGRQSDLTQGSLCRESNNALEMAE